MLSFWYRFTTVCTTSAVKIKQPFVDRRSKNNSLCYVLYINRPFSDVYHRSYNKVFSRNEFMVSCLRDSDYNSAVNLLDTLLENNDVDNMIAFQKLVNLCFKKEHLFTALKSISKLKQLDEFIPESTYAALIRCYCDANDTRSALNIVSMLLLKGEFVPKLRLISPILMSACREDDFEMVLHVTKLMQKSNVELQTEQFSLFLAQAVRNRSHITGQQKQLIHLLMCQFRDKLSGMLFSELQRTAVIAMSDDVDSCQNQNLLVGSVNNIVNCVPILSDINESRVTCSLQPCPVSSDVSAASLSPMCNLKNKLIQQCGHYYVQSVSRLVYIDSSNACCPNCGNVLCHEPFTTDEKDSVCKAVRATSRHVSAQLHIFSEWLGEREGFDFFVDGPNVAYCDQNFDNGDFSFKQIELVVNKLLQERSKRILVILPECYTMSSIPISVKGRSKRQLTQSEKVFLDKLREQDMLYVVPNGCNDDYFWLYATMCGDGRRQGRGRVVTNDQMRDHKEIFAAESSRLFARWRSAHVASFEFSSGHGCSSDDSSDGGGINSDLEDKVRSVVVSEPDTHIREAQYAANTDRWHIPALDRDNHWLCVSM